MENTKGKQFSPAGNLSTARNLGYHFCAKNISNAQRYRMKSSSPQYFQKSVIYLPGTAEFPSLPTFPTNKS